ncbi:MAG: hypothetical protein IJW55_00295 [Clostridia bacterium]|nr:hypothetical protein [Clostridia bacterium]
MKPVPYYHNPLQRVVEAFFLLLCGGVLYCGLEVLGRGWSHPSMAVCGALCFYFVYRVNERYTRVPVLMRALVGALFITGVELFAGCLLNLGLGLAVWDYSNMPYHFLGQICLPYSIFWFLLCIPLAGVSRLIRRHVFLSNV